MQQYFRNTAKLLKTLYEILSSLFLKFRNWEAPVAIEIMIYRDLLEEKNTFDVD